MTDAPVHAVKKDPPPTPHQALQQRCQAACCLLTSKFRAYKVPSLFQQKNIKEELNDKGVKQRLQGQNFDLCSAPKF